MRFAVTVQVLVTMMAVTVARGMSWDAVPLVVHEWGVESFDWSGNAPAAAQLPSFIYTDKRPGTQIPVFGKRTKDLPADSGVRDKPVLYFYVTSAFNPDPFKKATIPVGVEVRFANGSASAWWPQASIYRTPAQVAAAKPFDLLAWKTSVRARPLTRPYVQPLVPDDERFDLAWHQLTLDPFAAPTLCGAELRDDHWIKQARKPASAFVSNGKEFEKFLFYEGRTREMPSIRIGNDREHDWGPAARNHAIVNSGDRPIYDVFAVYRGPAGLWVGYISALEPAIPKDPATNEIPTQSCLPLPDFSGSGWGMRPQEFAAKTTPRLLEALTSGSSIAAGSRCRNPADPQPATADHALYPDEAAALENIWHDGLFGSDGLTVIYRESPAALDAAMPLHIYTDMYHYVKLSRCGLVVNRNIDIAAMDTIEDKIVSYIGADDESERQSALASLREHRLMALWVIRLDLDKWPAPYRDEVRKLVEVLSDLGTK
jgi:hypothetical protein